MANATPRTTLLDLVRTVQNYTSSDDEALAIITRLVNGGQVILCGNLAGRHIVPA